MPESIHVFPYIVNICYIFNEKGEVLLQKKARGFGQGNWNAPGGKVEKNESVEDSVYREILEETGIKLYSIEKAGELEFVFPHNEKINNYCYVFRSYDFKGEAKDTGEGELKWFGITDIPYDFMWGDDRYWLPQVLRGEKVHMRFYFDENNRINNHKNLN